MKIYIFCCGNKYILTYKFMILHATRFPKQNPPQQFNLNCNSSRHKGHTYNWKQSKLYNYK